MISWVQRYRRLLIAISVTMTFPWFMRVIIPEYRLIPLIVRILIAAAFGWVAGDIAVALENRHQRKINHDD